VEPAASLKKKRGKKDAHFIMTLDDFSAVEHGNVARKGEARTRLEVRKKCFLSSQVVYN
jgi:hypothetical protein